MYKYFNKYRNTNPEQCFGALELVEFPRPWELLVWVSLKELLLIITVKEKKRNIFIYFMYMLLVNSSSEDFLSKFGNLTESNSVEKLQEILRPYMVDTTITYDISLSKVYRVSYSSCLQIYVKMDKLLSQYCWLNFALK